MQKNVSCLLVLLKKLLALICERNGLRVPLFRWKLRVSFLAKPVLHDRELVLLPLLAFTLADAGAAGSLLQTGTYTYYVTSVTMRGESFLLLLL
jgi:hypothetical protein